MNFVKLAERLENKARKSGGHIASRLCARASTLRNMEAQDEALHAAHLRLRDRTGL